MSTNIVFLEMTGFCILKRKSVIQCHFIVKRTNEFCSSLKNMLVECPYIYLFGFLLHFQHCTDHITTGSWKGRGNQYIQFIRVLYCKLLTNGKQLPAFPLEAVPGTEPWPQRWEARVLPLCHRGPLSALICNNLSLNLFHFTQFSGFSKYLCQRIQNLGPISQRDLSPDLVLNLRLWS